MYSFSLSPSIYLQIISRNIRIIMKTMTDEQKVFIKVEKMIKCYLQKCSKEQEMYNKKKAKFQNDLNNARLLFFNNKIKEQEFRKKLVAIKQKMDKTEEKQNAVQCQLNHCYEKTKKSVLYSIDHLLKYVDRKKDLSKYSILMKYKNIFSKKITFEHLIKFDQDMIKIGFEKIENII